MPRDKLVSQRKFAEEAGISRAYVQKLIAAGKIPTADDGQIPLARAKKALAAMKQGAEETREGRKAGAAESTGIKAELQRAKLREQTARARQRELEAAREEGRYVLLEDVERDARQAAATIRARLLKLGARVALELEALCSSVKRGPRAAEIEALINAQVNEALAELNRTRFAAGGAGRSESR